MSIDPHERSGWHADASLVERYVAGEVAAVEAASIEAHLLACGACRALVAEQADGTRVALNWSAVADRIDRPRLGPLERLLTAAGVREDRVRLGLVTPSLRAPWLVAVAVVLAGSVALARDAANDDRGFYLFLALAPLLPLLGVAGAFARGADPLHELVLAAPIPSLELLLVRTTTVLVTTTALTGLATLATDRYGLRAVAWLMPALGLTTCTLALTRWISATSAAAGLAIAWIAAASLSLLGASRHADVVSDFFFFRPTGQTGLAIAAVLAIAFIATQRDAFDLRRQM